jgi:hypothetical protein
LLVPRKTKSPKPEVVGLLGVGLDHADGHKRITQAEDILLIGGSEETHEKMQDVVIYFSESLDQRGKSLRDAEPQEVIDLLQKAMDR